MKVKEIKNDKELKNTLIRLFSIFHSKESSSNYNEFVLLSRMIEEYEEKYYPIPEVLQKKNKDNSPSSLI